ncbi:hypothetical protein LDENG_00045380 [Lucifuga dentata]|nr:hypothetical protein LDENG_00045380 [Lucifuga dentata]
MEQTRWRTCGWRRETVVLWPAGGETGGLRLRHLPDRVHGGVPQPVWEVSLNCDGSESTLRDCRLHGTRRKVQGKNNSTSTVQITCSDSVRLLGSHLCSGRVEVKSDGGWTRACRDGFDLNSQKDCDDHNNCTAAQEVSCRHVSEVRLVGGASRCAGLLEVKQGRERRPVTDTWRSWKDDHSSQVCSLLDCGNAVSTSHTHLLSQHTWELPDDCRRGGGAASLCQYWEYGSMTSGVSVTCSESVRLVSGCSRCVGYLEVRSGGSWALVCLDSLDLQDQLVVCRDVGCGFPDPESFSGGGEPGLIWTGELCVQAERSGCWTVPAPTRPPTAVEVEPPTPCAGVSSLYSVRSFRLRNGMYTPHQSELVQTATNNTAYFLFPAACTVDATNVPTA